MKMWIARDENGYLFLHRNKPHTVIWCNTTMWTSLDCWQLHTKDYPEVTFENSPMEVELKLIEK